MRVIQTEELARPPDTAPAGPTPLIQTDGLRSLLLNLGVGQSVGPCEMSNTVLYYVIRGRGRLQVGDEGTDLRDGSLAVVEAGAVRKVSAVEPMRVLLVQVL